MKHFLSIVSLILFFLIQAQAQFKPIHTTEFPDNGEQVFIHSGTGIPVFQTTKSYIAIHPQTFEKMWEVKRQTVAVVGEATGEEKFADYYELPSSNIVYIGNNFVNVLNGNVIADGNVDEIRRISSFHLFPAKNLLAVKVIAKGVYRLYGFDPVKNELKWKTDIDKSGLNLTTITDNDPITTTIRGLKPYIASTGDIVYVHQKDMMLIDPDNGKLIWSQPLEPGGVLFSKSGKLVAVAERRTGLGSVMDMSGGTKFGKKLVVIDAATGENAWKKEIKLDGNIIFMQPYRDGFIVAHEEGFNIYDFNSPKGEPQWKKDFAAKEISDIVEEGENIMVYYKDRRMLMNPVTGDDVWKKPEKLEEEIPVFAGGEENQIGKIKITHSGTSVRVTNSATNGYKVVSGEVVGYNKDLSTLLATFDDRANSALVKVGQHAVLATYIDLNTMKSISEKFFFQKPVSGISPVQDRWFVYSPNEFILLRQEAGKLVKVKEKLYPVPGSFQRGLANVMIGAIATGAAVSSVYESNKALVVGNYNDYQIYRNHLAANEAVLNLYDAKRPRATLPTIDRDYAFFFSKDDRGNLVLFQIKKQTGEETASYVFDNKTPSYELDYVNGKIYYLNGKTMKVYQLQVE